MPGEPSAGVPRCYVVDPIAGGDDEEEHSLGPRCSVRVDEPWSSVGVRESNVSATGNIYYQLPTAYLHRYPKSDYPFDDPVAEWMYVRGWRDPAYISWSSALDFVGQLQAIGMIPYLLYEVLESGYLDTPAGYLRPQIRVRYWIGMIVTTQVLEDPPWSWTDDRDMQRDEGGRVVNFLGMMERASARIRTFRREDGNWVGHDKERRWEIADGQHWASYLNFEDSDTEPLANKTAARAGTAMSAIGQIMLGEVVITEDANRSLDEEGLTEEMVRTGFECLVGDRVEFSYTVSFREGIGGDKVAADMARCLTIDDLQPICDFALDYMALRITDEGRFVFQGFDLETLREAAESC